MKGSKPGLTVPAPGVLANDSDPDGDPLTAMLISHPYYGGTVRMNRESSISVPAPGVLANDYDEVESDNVLARLIRPTSKGTLDLRADGSFTYTRDPGEHRRDRFIYEVYDSGGAVGNRVIVYLYPGFY